MTHHDKIGIFAGSFDPITLGHLDLIERSSRLFDKVIVLIAINTSKVALFTAEERLNLVQTSISALKNVEVDILEDGLVATYFAEKKATAMIRGLRNTIDFEYESGIAIANHLQNPDLETVTLFADEKYRHLSSSLIKEIARFNGDVSKMVPAKVAEAMSHKYKH
uniref:pantetheine-phosphate adenylyltransferase n=1 Tax=Jeotgalibaca porci TaxID=1868793 RepID=UPI0035A13317